MFKLAQIINQRKEQLEKGEIVTIVLKDGVVSISNEFDEVTSEMKVVTYVEEADLHMNMKVEELLSSN